MQGHKVHQSKLTQENLLELSAPLYSASHPSAAVVWRSELPDTRCYSFNSARDAPRLYVEFKLLVGGQYCRILWQLGLAPRHRN